MREIQYKGSELPADKQHIQDGHTGAVADKQQPLPKPKESKKPGILARLRLRITRPLNPPRPNEVSEGRPAPIKAYDATEAIPQAEPVTSRPGGIRHTKPATWKPGQSRSGGRIVKSMPRELRQLKEDQEPPEDD